MKIILVSLLLFVSSNCWAIFGIEALKKDVHNNNQKIQEQNKNITAELGVIKDNTIKLQADLKANLQATAKVQAGYDKSNTQTAGRDITTTNDTELMKAVIKSKQNTIYLLYLIVASLVVIVSTTITKLFSTIKYRNNVIKSADRKDKVIKKYMEKVGAVTLEE